MKLCVFPGGTLRSLSDKGELKPGYYNPENLFDEIHFITFTDQEVDAEKIKIVGGTARIFIHPVGSIKPHNVLSLRHDVLELARQIDPDAIRAYTTSMPGYYAAYCAKKLRRPFVLSLHTHFDDTRHIFWKTKQWKNWLVSTLMKHSVERFVVQNADHVICAYTYPRAYAEAYGAKKISVIYNKVYQDAFDRAVPTLKMDKPAVIFVGRLIPEKSPENLIRAIQHLDVNLIIIGNGPLYPHLMQLAEKLGVNQRVRFFPTVANTQIAGYYKSARVFALPLLWGGVAIPVLEAMAAGLPVIVSRSELDPNPEISSEVGLVVDNTPESFAEALGRVLSDATLYEELHQKSRSKFMTIEGRKMEKKEADIYRKLWHGGKQ